MSDPVARHLPRYVYEIPSRLGVERWYFWRGKGHPRIRIREAPGSPEFHICYGKLLNGPMPVGNRAEPRERTLGWLAQQWFIDMQANPALEPGTKENYRTIVNAMLREVVEAGRPETYTDFPLDRITAKTVRNLRNRKREKPTAGNARVSLLKLMFSWAMEDGQEYVTNNPAADVPRFATRKGGFHTWTVAELLQYEARHPVGTKARLALDLLSFTGARGSDVVKLGRQHVKDGWVFFTPVKTKRTGTMVKLPICDTLAASINATPCGDLTFLVTERTGIPYRPVHFRRTFKTWAKAAGLPSHCMPHGVRKAAAARAAEHGATSKQLQAMFGWLSSAQADRYTRDAEVAKLSSDAITFLRR